MDPASVFFSAGSMLLHTAVFACYQTLVVNLPGERSPNLASVVIPNRLEPRSLHNQPFLRPGRLCQRMRSPISSPIDVTALEIVPYCDFRY